MITVTCPIKSASINSPKFVAVHSEQGDLDFKELNSLVDLLAINLQDKGITEGSRVGVLSRNNADMLASIFSLQRLGATSCLLNLQLTKNDWAAQLQQANCSVAIGEEEYLSSIELPKLNKFHFEQLKNESISKEVIDSELVTSRESVIIFTSGSTGHNKGVRLSVGNLLSSATASNKLTKLSPGDTWGVSLPMYHLGGLGIVYRTLTSGASARFQTDFSPNTLYNLIKENKLTHLSAVPTTLSGLIDLALENPLSKDSLLGGLKCVILAGAASSETLLNKIIEYKLPILSAWGMTETTAHCTCMDLNDPKEYIKSVGKPFHHTKLKLLDDEGNEIKEGTGEILINGPTVFMGYLDESQTENVLKDGWLHSGDLGYFNEDGNLTIAGRKDDMIISGGENIHTGEIEKIAKAISGVKDCAVIPIPHPKWGQRPILLVEPKTGSKLTEELIYISLKENLAKIKIPDRIIFRELLPRTSIGKVDYKALKAEFK
jgi:O-succinylbenzoic acid--CoA ligase